MFVSVVDALVERLQAEQAPGGMLEEVRLVRAGDMQPIPTQHHPAITVDWDGTRDLRLNHQRVEFRARLLVHLYTVSLAGTEQAEREADRLVWDDSTGSPRGLLPALCRAARTSLVVGGQSYILQIGDSVMTVAVKDKSHSTGLSRIEVQAVTMRNSPQ